jgi:predicted DNA binding CopG/RHH family protein
MENHVTKKPAKIPKFNNESAEADWWTSPAGRDFAKQASQAPGNKPTGSKLVAQLNKSKSTQIAIRLPDSDLEQARKIADQKGIGYQTLLKMIVHEGLRREGERP